jgi:hypothetical protein
VTKTIVNLTKESLIEAIESVLETYPHHPYQKAFSLDDLRQDLIAYVLNRVSNIYIVEEPLSQTPVHFSTSLYHSPEERWHLEGVIHQGIEYVLCKNADKVCHHIPEEMDPGSAPSCWFG